MQSIPARQPLPWHVPCAALLVRSDIMQGHVSVSLAARRCDLLRLSVLIAQQHCMQSLLHKCAALTAALVTPMVILGAGWVRVLAQTTTCDIGCHPCTTAMLG